MDSGEQLGEAEIAAAVALLRAAGVAAPAVVLVEGASDKAALHAVAQRRGRDLEGVLVASIGGATNAGRVLEALAGSDVRLAGLCDAAEERDYSRGLARAGFGTDLSRDDMEELGFFVCVEDLEDELIRALGAAAVEGLLDEDGQLRRFRKFQNQPHQRHRTVEEQLRRFMGTTSGRKIRYAALLAEALDPANVPRPIEAVLAHV